MPTPVPMYLPWALQWHTQGRQAFMPTAPFHVTASGTLLVPPIGLGFQFILILTTCILLFGSAVSKLATIVYQKTSHLLDHRFCFLCYVLFQLIWAPVDLGISSGQSCLLPSIPEGCATGCLGRCEFQTVLVPDILHTTQRWNGKLHIWCGGLSPNPGSRPWAGIWKALTLMAVTLLITLRSLVILCYRFPQCDYFVGLCILTQCLQKTSNTILYNKKYTSKSYYNM